MNIFIESIFFSFIMIISSFIIGYIGDFIKYKKINWIPQHFLNMTSGILITSFTVYILFSNKYNKWKCGTF